jgi:tetratricopeptide (TPR) repeat protein
VSKKSHEEAERPDAFISVSDKIISWVEKHYKSVVFVFAVIFFAGVLVVVVRHYNESREQAALGKLYKAEKSFKDKVVEEEKGSAAEDSKSTDDKRAEEVKKPSNIEKTVEFLQSHYAEQMAAIEKVVEESRGLQASSIGALALSEIYTEYGDPEKAKAILQSTAEGLSKNDFFFGLIHTRLGAILSDLGDCESANKHFSQVVDVAAQNYLHAEALLNTALCYEALDQLDQAESSYNRVIQEFNESDAGQAAKNYLRLLKLKNIKAGA